MKAHCDVSVAIIYIKQRIVKIFQQSFLMIESEIKDHQRNSSLVFFFILTFSTLHHKYYPSASSYDNDDDDDLLKST